MKVSLLEQRSRCLQWNRSTTDGETSSASAAVDNAINFDLLGPADADCSTNPILNAEYLDAHDAVLLCGPYHLEQFADGQAASLSLSSHQLLQSTARNFLVHLKYVPSTSSVSILPGLGETGTHSSTRICFP